MYSDFKKQAGQAYILEAARSGCGFSHGAGLCSTGYSVHAWRSPATLFVVSDFGSSELLD